MSIRVASTVIAVSLFSVLLPNVSWAQDLGANQVRFFDDGKFNESGDGDRTFTGAQHKEKLDDEYFLNTTNKMGDSIQSLLTGSSAWLVIYEDEYFQDTIRFIGPNRRLDEEDLDNIDISEEIDSFVMFDRKPSWWDKVTSNEKVWRFRRLLANDEPRIMEGENAFTNWATFNGPAGVEILPAQAGKAAFTLTNSKRTESFIGRVSAKSKKQADLVYKWSRNKE